MEHIPESFQLPPERAKGGEVTYISHSSLCSLITSSVLADDFLVLISKVLKVRPQLSFNSKQTDFRRQKEVLETQNIFPICSSLPFSCQR